jgi:hypothetical protein
MTNSVRFLTLLGAMLAIFIQAPSAHAQASRTWVSGVGDDANPCSRTAPCKTFAGAISKTASGGEIDVLDPGGFGALTITKPITLDGSGGSVGSILVAGTNGIVVSAGSGAVTLRNLSINGVGSGLDGIKYLSGSSLMVENCEIFGFTQNGIEVASSAGINNIVIQNTTTYNNTQGGIQIKPTAGTVNVAVIQSQANKNSFGIGVDTTGGGSVLMQIDRSTASENAANGLQVAGTNAVAEINLSTFSFDGNGVSITAPGAVGTFTNNVITQNTTNNVVGTLTTKPLH